jgi:hypothetical protein
MPGSFRVSPSKRAAKGSRTGSSTLNGTRGGEQTTALHAARGEVRLEREHRVHGAGDDRQRRAVDRGHGQAGRQLTVELLRGGAHREHRPARELLDEAGATSEETHGVVAREDAGEAGGYVLAQAVPHHGLRLDAPGAPEARERVLDDEDRGLGEAGLRELRGRPLFVSVSARRVEDSSQVQAQLRPQNLGALVHLAPEDGLGLVQTAAHVHVLRPLSREEERHARSDGRGRPRNDRRGSSVTAGRWRRRGCATTARR